MEIVELRVEDLKPYEKNAKKHPAEQVEHIANSIREFGWQQPIVLDRNNVVVIGHGRLMAAKSLNLETVPCVYADGLTDEQINALRLADNKTNESEWDFDMLGLELDGILDLDMTMFGFMDTVEEEEPEVVEDDFEPVLPEEPKAKRGDVYQLGDHRLMCGDSTALSDVTKLLGELGGGGFGSHGSTVQYGLRRGRKHQGSEIKAHHERPNVIRGFPQVFDGRVYKLLLRDERRRIHLRVLQGAWRGRVHYRDGCRRSDLQAGAYLGEESACPGRIQVPVDV